MIVDWFAEYIAVAELIITKHRTHKINLVSEIKVVFEF